MKYGLFDEHAKEYVITRPDTPLSWSNYLGTTDAEYDRNQKACVSIPAFRQAGMDFSVDMRLRGQIFNIHVHNPQQVCQVVVRMIVDGQEVEGNLIPGDHHQVEDWLGK